MQARRFDLALQMQGNGRYANACVGLWAARSSAGFCLPDDYVPHPGFYFPYPDDIPEVHRHMRLMALLGLDIETGDHLEFPLTAADTQAFSALATQLDTPTPFPAKRMVCIHPGGHSVARRWSATGFAQVADALVARRMSIVLTGTADERDLTRRVALAMKRPALDLTGRTTLGTLGVLFQRAQLLISNSTGVAHLACALDLPSIVIFRNCDPRRWGPLDRNRHRLHQNHQATVGSIVADADELLATATRR
jgi:ADP-heptose:LPS heptosyltransferase